LALRLDKTNPEKVLIAQTNQYLPCEHYECVGDVPNVVSAAETQIDELLSFTMAEQACLVAQAMI
jgi:predicted GH43/DUF377 family glycosyl hydrolase